MITSVKIDGFKSFLDFRLDVHPCTILMGENGSGKSNLLDALDLVRRTVTSGFHTALGSELPLAPRHLFHHAEGADGLYTAPVLSIQVGMIVPSQDGPLPLVVWLEVERDAAARRAKGAVLPVSCSVWVSSMDRTGWMARLGLPLELREALAQAREAFVRRTGTDWVSLDGTGTPSPSQEGRGDELLALLHRECRTWQPVTFEQAAMRRPFGGSDTEPLAADGSNLAGVLHRLREEDRAALEADLAAIVPEVTGLRPLFDDRRGEYDFDVRFRHTGWTSPPLLSRGTLRVLGLLTAWYDESRAGLLAVEDLEHGLHPTRLAGLFARLRRDVDDYPDMAARAPRVAGFRQLLATTHSPLLLSALRAEAPGSLVYLEEAEHRHADRDVVSTVTRARPVRECRPGEDPERTLSAQQMRELLGETGQTVG